MASPRNASLRAAALSRITAGSVSRERARWKRERRNRVPDRSPRRSIVGQAIKGTLIVASDEQWRHRNYRYTPDTLFGPLDTYSLSLSLFPPSSSLVSFALFACVYHPSCTHGAVLVVCTLVKHRWQQACERILRVTTLVRAPLSATLLVECRDGVDTCSVQTIHPLPLPRENHGQSASSLQAIQEFGPRASCSVWYKRGISSIAVLLGRAVSSSLSFLFV